MSTNLIVLITITQLSSVKNPTVFRKMSRQSQSIIEFGLVFRQKRFRIKSFTCVRNQITYDSIESLVKNVEVLKFNNVN